MIKELHCSKCGCYCGEMRLGRIMKDVILICAKCSKKQEKDDTADFLKNLFGMKG